MAREKEEWATLGDVAPEGSMRLERPEVALEPLPSLDAPADRAPVSLAEACARIDSERRTDLVDVYGSAGAWLAIELSNRSTRPVCIVTHDEESAHAMGADLRFFAAATGTAPSRVRVVGEPEVSAWAEVMPDRRAAMLRLASLAAVARGDCDVLVVPAMAMARRQIAPERLEEATLEIVAEAELDRDDCVARLVAAGYQRAPLVEDPGSFAVRGALLDVWPADSEHPLRVELYGELVVHIRPFDPSSQTTLEGASVTRVFLPPVRDAIATREATETARRRLLERAEAVDFPTTKTRALVDDVCSGRSFPGLDAYLPAFGELVPLARHLPDETTWLVSDPPAVERALAAGLAHFALDGVDARRSGPRFTYDEHYLTEHELGAFFRDARLVTLGTSPVLGEAEGPLAALVTTRDPVSLGARDQGELARAMQVARSTKERGSHLAPLARRITHFRAHGYDVLVTARGEMQAERLAALLAHRGTPCEVVHGRYEPFAVPTRAPTGTARIVVGQLARGVVLPREHMALVTEEEIFGSRGHRKRERRPKRSTEAFLEDLQNLAVGDYVVHVEHGIGRYLGLLHKAVGGVTVDLLAVEYQGGDKLYLPVHRLSQIQKYQGAEAGAPKLDRLGGSTFAKTKSRVRKAIVQMADELLKSFAERKGLARPALAELDDDYRAFEATFAFDETADQARAIDEVNADLSASSPMDRLICGDVGFGKTEVAIRAAYRMAMSGRQVALLCPTTVLAQQHFRTLEARLHEHALTVRVLSRFQSKKEQSEILAGLKKGTIDVVVGTHRLLSKDVHFKDLGLLVVDEEQRFGVGHKERIKQLRAHVDVLTLSATPIPRTLKMAIGGLRDLSLITTPPVDRRAVRTLVTRWDDTVVRDAVERELARGGQIFFVHNRIDGLYERARRLQELVPRARIAVAHGQMAKGDGRGDDSALEKTMLDFVDGHYDVLAATTIIESGLDIPRANTILIDRADTFGLAQLYQLRGRVGRSRERAYCYLIVPELSTMSDEARARVDALERYTELGSGFKIASLDLELRGAGDLLGGEQSGHVASVGLDLFCRMLDEAIVELRGEAVTLDVDPELTVDVEALLPEDYIADVGLRLSFYKRLASAEREATVDELALELEDRFGPPPEPAKRLVALMRVKSELRRFRALGLEATGRTVTLHLREDTPLDATKILELVRAKDSPWKLTPDMRLTRRFPAPERDGIAAAEAVLAALEPCMKPERA